jgi:hypothetical protein
VKVVNQFKAAGEGKLNAAPPIEVSVYVKHGKTAKQRCVWSFVLRHARG